MIKKGLYKTGGVGETLKLGEEIGRGLKGGEVIELVGDLGAGKTTLVRGIAAGLGSEDEVASPSFTISRIYKGKNGLSLAHFDFYRLRPGDVGILKEELDEAVQDLGCVVCIEWADSVREVLPEDVITIKISTTSEDGREVDVR